MCTEIVTKKAKEAIEIAEKQAIEGENIIIAVGGDGTCNEVVNGIVKSGNRDVIFGIIPNGTGNDFQRMLGRFEPKTFVHNLINRSFRKIDLCEITQFEGNGYALNIAGAGFDAFVVNQLNRQRKMTFIGGKFSYALAILRSFAKYNKPLVQIRSAQCQFKGKIMMVVVCNGRNFGHGLVIQPFAKIDDGLLSVALIGDISLMDYLRNIGKLKRGVIIIHPEVKYFDTKEVNVELLQGKMEVEMDGENLKGGSTQFRVCKESLKVLTN